jgi:hypothetical protein
VARYTQPLRQTQGFAEIVREQADKITPIEAGVTSKIYSSTSGRAGGLKDSEPLKAACQFSRLKAAYGYQSPI